MTLYYFNLLTHLVKQLKKYNFYISEEEIKTDFDNSSKLSFYLYDKYCNPVYKKATILDTESRRYEILDITDKYEYCERVIHL